jgi:hypothetical protein
MKTIIIVLTFILLSNQGYSQKNKVINEIKYDFCDTSQIVNNEKITLTYIRYWQIQDSANVLVATKTYSNGEFFSESYLLNSQIYIVRSNSLSPRFFGGYKINDSIDMNCSVNFYENGKIMSAYFFLSKRQSPFEEINGFIIFFNKKGRQERMEYYVEDKLVFTQEVAKNWKKSNFDNIKLVPK